MVLTRDLTNAPPPPPPPTDAKSPGRLATLMGPASPSSAERAEKPTDLMMTMSFSPPRHGANLRGWLARILRNAVSDERRRHSLRCGAETTSARDRAGGVAASGARADDPVLGELARLVDTAPEPYRTVLVLRFREDHTPAEIARRTGKPVNTVQSQLQRGLRQLRERLDRHHAGDRRAWAGALVLALRRRAARRDPLSATLGVPLAAAAAGLALLAIAWIALGRGLERDSAGGARPVQARAAAPVRVDAPGAPGRSGAAGGSTRVGLVTGEAAAVERSSAAPAQRALAVEVVDAFGDPVAGAAIHALEQSTPPIPGKISGVWAQRASTDPRGRATLAVLDGDLIRIGGRAPRLQLRATADGLVSSGLYLVCAGGRAEPLRMELGGPGSSLEGRVTDAEGEPVAGATVQVGRGGLYGRPADPCLEVTPAHQWVATDGAGAYAVSGVAASRVGVWVQAPGFLRHVGAVDLGGRSRARYDVTLSEGGILSGRVLAASGEPAAGARVWVDQPVTSLNFETRAYGEGRFRLEGLPLGVHLAWARDPREPDQLARLRFHSCAGVERTWEARCAARQPLSIRLLDDRGEPVAGRRTSLVPSTGTPRTLRTDALGRAACSDYGEGPLTLAVYGPAPSIPAIPVLWRDEFVPREEEWVVVVPRAADESCAVRGSFTMAGGGPPEAGSLLVLTVAERADYFVGDHQPETGRFEIGGVPAGEYELWAQTTLGRQRLGELSLLPGEVRELGPLRCTEPRRVPVSWEGGEPPLGYRVQTRLVPRAGTRRWVIVEPGGGLPDWLDLWPGTYYVEALLGPGRSVGSWFTVHPSSGEAPTRCAGECEGACGEVRLGG